MSGDRIINISGGAYNEAVYGDSINFQDNSVHIQNNSTYISQNLSQAAIQLCQQLAYFQSKGDSPEEAQRKVASDLAVQIRQKPGLIEHLKKLGRYVSTEATNGLIGEAAVVGIKAVLSLIGIPLL